LATCTASATRAPTGCSTPSLTAGLNGRSLRYPRGKTLGGCSSINGMIYMRGQARDYDGWAHTTGDASWSWENSLPTSCCTKTTTEAQGLFMARAAPPRP